MTAAAASRRTASKLLFRPTAPLYVGGDVYGVYMRTFLQVLVNTAIANVTSSYLWFALTFWVYIETKSVLATGIIGGAYMLLIAIFAMLFGTIVDRHRKHAVMVFAGVFTLVAFGIAWATYSVLPESTLLDLGQPWFW